MKHKYSTLANIKNRVITPKEIGEALESLPFNFIKKTTEVLTQWKEVGEIEKIFSPRYITAVRSEQTDDFNEVIMFALLVVGLEEIQKRKHFPGKKKTS